MFALVLVGGQGTRLRPLTYTMPKPMLPIVERPIIVQVLDWLGEFGVTKAVFSLGYRPDAFVDAFPDGKHAGIELLYAVESTPLDTAGAIRFAASETGLLDERLIVVNGDVLTDLDLDELVGFHDLHRGLATIMLTAVEDPSAYGVVPTEPDGQVQSFIEKPPAGQAPTNHINAGIYVLDPEVLAEIDSDRRVSIEREIFPRLVDKGNLFAMFSEAYWIDTGTPEHYLQAQFDLLRGRRSHCAMPLAHEHAPQIFVAPEATLEGEINAPAYIGARAHLGAGSVVAEAVIGDDCRLGPGSSVRSSVLLPGAVIGGGVSIEDSIIGPGAFVANGAKVRAVTIVGAGVSVEQDALLDGARIPA